MDKVVSLIKEAKKVAILTHVSEDGDAMGSGFALLEALRGMGKEATLYISEEPEARLSLLGSDYVIYDEDTKYDGFDLCVALDSADEKRFGRRLGIFKSCEKTVNIDHHLTNPNYADANYVLADASSTGEVLYDVFCALGVKMNKRIAECLYVAIVTDTGLFKYSSVSPKTLKITAEILEQGIDHATICRLLFDTEPIGAIRLKAHIMKKLKTCFDGKLCIATVPEKTFKKFGVLERDMGDIVNIPRSVALCEVAVSIRDGNGKVKVGLRSNGKVDVSKIAQSLGGGGHKMASGVSFTNKSLKEVEKIIIKAVGEVFKNDRV